MKSEEKEMVDIKGLDKARVMKALLEKYTQNGYLHGRVLKVDLSRDEFDERLYDRDCGEGAAQRAVDSVRAEQEGGGDAAGNADGEKKEPSLEEQAEMTKEAIHKIMDILDELPPVCHIVASMTLRMALSGPVSDMTGMMMGRPFALPMGRLLGMKTSVHIADEFDRAPFPFKG